MPHKLKIKVAKKVKDVGSHRGGIVRIDSRLPKRYHKSITMHERLEDYLQRERGMPHNKAHAITEKMEKQAFWRNNPKGWREYEKTVNKLAG